MLENTCWNVTAEPHSCPDVGSYINPKSHKIRAEVRDLPEGEHRRLHLAHDALSGARARRPHYSAMQCRVELEVPYPAGARIAVDVGGRKSLALTLACSDLFIVGLGDSFGSGEGNPDVPVRFSRERGADYGLRDKDVALDRLSRSCRAPGNRSATPSSSMKMRAGSIRPATARSIRISCAQPCSWPSKSRTAPSRSLASPARARKPRSDCSCATRATSGCRTRRSCRRSPPLADAQCAQSLRRTAYDLPEAYHINERVPELKGGLVLKQVRRRQARDASICCSCRSAATIWALPASSPMLCWPINHSLRNLGGWFGQVHGPTEAQALLDVLGDRYKSLNRAFHSILHVPWNESDRIVLTGYPPMAVAGRRQIRLPRRPRGHDGAARLRHEPDQVARGRCRG